MKLRDEKEDFTDPLYGKRYLPRKFKVALAIPPLNDIDVFTNDVIAERGRAVVPAGTGEAARRGIGGGAAFCLHPAGGPLGVAQASAA